MIATAKPSLPHDLPLADDSSSVLGRIRSQRRQLLNAVENRSSIFLEARRAGAPPRPPSRAVAYA
jgi:hypothetical protein